MHAARENASLQNVGKNEIEARVNHRLPTNGQVC